MIDGRLVPSMLDVLLKWKKVAAECLQLALMCWLVATELMKAIASGCRWRISYKIEDAVFIGELPVVNNSYFACAD